jgi:hypothetical protein
VRGKSNQAKIKPEKNIKLETKKEFFLKDRNKKKGSH